MIGLMIICWAYLILMIVGRVVNYDKVSKQAIIVRVVDNVVIFVLMAALFFLYTQG